MPDCDIFARASTRARAAGAALLCALSDDAIGGAPDLWRHLEGCLNEALRAADGIPMLGALCSYVDDRASRDVQPLLFDDDSSENELTAIEHLEREHGDTVLDLMLCRAARREALVRPLDAHRIIERFVLSYCMGTIVLGRRGLIETQSSAWVSDHEKRIVRILEPFAKAAAAELARRPDARTVHAPAPASSGPIDPIVTNLLGRFQ